MESVTWVCLAGFKLIRKAQHDRGLAVMALMGDDNCYQIQNRMLYGSRKKCLRIQLPMCLHDMLRVLKGC